MQVNFMDINRPYIHWNYVTYKIGINWKDSHFQVFHHTVDVEKYPNIDCSRCCYYRYIRYEAQHFNNPINVKSNVRSPSY